jgi:hypothetical protein
VLFAARIRIVPGAGAVDVKIKIGARIQSAALKKESMVVGNAMISLVKAGC